MLRVRKKVVLLSYREAQLAGSSAVRFIPPGVNLNEEAVTSHHGLTWSMNSSYSWLPKKKSQLSNSEIETLNSQYLGVDDLGIGQIGIIEDRFQVGFKLKLLQMLYVCDFVYSRVDLRREIAALGLDDSYFFQFSNVDEIQVPLNARDREKLLNARISNREIIARKYNWKTIGAEIVKLLD